MEEEEVNTPIPKASQVKIQLALKLCSPNLEQ